MTKREVKNKPQNASRQSNDSLFIVGGIGVLIVASILIFAVTSSTGSESDQSSQPEAVMTLDPQVVINLTQVPQATALSAADAAIWNEFRAQVDACEDYDDARRSQMEQHITWLIDPSDMPRDVILGLGSDPTERLIFGMASYTSIQWRLLDRPADSCLVPIGLRLNEMLVAIGSEPFDIYDDVTADAESSS